MKSPSIQELYDVCEATWPPASATAQGPWIIRDGKGGGQRVSAATASAPAGASDLGQAEKAMKSLGQIPLFMIRAGQDRLDQMLDDNGYRVVDPVNAYVCPTQVLCALHRPAVSGFSIWPPLEIMTDIWAQGGIDAKRIDVMTRADVPKTTLLARKNDRAAGVAYVGIHNGVAMLHALEVSRDMRRLGVARTLMGHVGHWARQQGASHLSLLVTRQNTAANALYASLGMEIVGHYHYRKL